MIKKLIPLFIAAAMLVAASSCHKKQQVSQAQSQPGAPGASATPGTPGTPGAPAAQPGQTTAMPAPSQPAQPGMPEAAATTTPTEQPWERKQLYPQGFGTIKGKLYLGQTAGFKGNLFVYIIDEKTVNEAPSQQTAIASQVIPADRISGDMIDYTLANVPSGEYLVTAVWDVGEPYCAMSKPVCELAETDMNKKDRIGQSDIVKVMPNTTVPNASFNLN